MRDRLLHIGIGAAATLLLASSGASAAPIASSGPGEKGAAELREYWTPERMRAAEPLDLARPVADLSESLDIRAAAGIAKPKSVRSAPSSYAAVTQTNTTAPGTRTHGKVFGSSASGNFSCSATVVNSPNESTVWTAAHCIYYNASEGFSTNLVFVPGYNQGARPFGTWTARNSFVPANWVSSGASDFRDDVGTLLIQKKLREKTTREKRKCNRRFEGKPGRKRRCRRKQVWGSIKDKVGARGITFSQDPNDFIYRAFGYPAQPSSRFDGEHLELCVSEFTGVDGGYPEDPKPISMACDMQEGSSGGGWVISRGRVNGNVSYGYHTLDPNHSYSPYFDDFTKRFYNAIKNK